MNTAGNGARMSDKDVNGMMEKRRKPQAREKRGSARSIICCHVRRRPQRVTHACLNPSEGCVCRGGFQPLSCRQNLTFFYRGKLVARPNPVQHHPSLPRTAYRLPALPFFMRISSLCSVEVHRWTETREAQAEEMFTNLIIRQVLAVIAHGFQALQIPPQPGI
jgi:hypothetical protein